MSTTQRFGRGRAATFAAVGLLAVTTLFLGACSSAATSRSGLDAGTGAGVGTTTSGYEVGAPAIGAPDAQPMASAAASAATGKSNPGAPGVPTTGGGDLTASDAKVVKTGRMSLDVKSIDDSVAAARTAIVAVGGYVSGTDASDQGEKTYATITYRIPADRWDDALTALRKLATKVVAEQTTAVEVTGQVLDLGARITNLRATETALLGIMTKATKIPDILAVQQELTTVQGQIEELSTQKAHLEDQAALGTLTVDFSVPVAAIAQTQEGWDPGAELDRAVATLVGIGQGLASAGIWLAIVGLPSIVVLLLVLALALAIVRRAGLRLPDRRLPPSSGPLPPADQPGASAA